MGSSAGKIIKAVLPIAVGFLAPELAPFLGITSSLGTAALGAGLGGLGGAVGGGGLKGALLGAATGGLGAGGGDLIAGDIGLTGTGASIASKALTGAAAGGLNGGGKGALIGGLSGGALGGLQSVLAGGAPGIASGDQLLSDGGSVSTGINAADLSNPANASLTSGGPVSVGGGGASSFGVSNGAGAGSSFGSSIGSNTSLSNLLSGVGNLSAENTAEDQLVKSQQNSLNALKPFLNNGTGASNTLATELGTNGNTGASNYGSLTTPFTANDLQNEPGYQFDLQQGNNALNNSLAAGGMLGSGAAIKAGQQFSQGLADTTYNNAFNRDLQTKQFDASALSGAAGTGLSAANSTADVNNNIGTAQSKGTTSKANTITSALSGLLSGSGARPIIGYKDDGTPIYG